MVGSRKSTTSTRRVQRTDQIGTALSVIRTTICPSRDKNISNQNRPPQVHATVDLTTLGLRAGKRTTKAQGIELNASRGKGGVPNQPWNLNSLRVAGEIKNAVLANISKSKIP